MVTSAIHGNLDARLPAFPVLPRRLPLKSSGACPAMNCASSQAMEYWRVPHRRSSQGSVVERLERRRNTAAARDEALARVRMQRHHRRATEQAANSTMSPTRLPGAGMMRTAVVLRADHADSASSAMIAERGSGVVSPGTAIMSRPTEQTQITGFQLVKVIAPTRRLRSSRRPRRPG